MKGVDALHRSLKFILLVLAVALTLSGCGFVQSDELYQLPKYSPDYAFLQDAVDEEMDGLAYCAPISGPNRQPVQTADLTGDGIAEYLVFARSKADMSLHVLIFQKNEGICKKIAELESNGSDFSQVEYVEADDHPGMELVLGRQVSDQVPGSVSVYSLHGEDILELMHTQYNRFITCDLDQDSRSDLVVIASSSLDSRSASARLYRCGQDNFYLAGEAELSFPVSAIQKIVWGSLQNFAPAVFIAGLVDEETLQTDVLAWRSETFRNISASGTSGNSVGTRRDQLIYAEDVDEDGVLELPKLGNAKVVENGITAKDQYLICWYALNPQGDAINKMHTFHNFKNGWYLQLKGDWAQRVFVEIQDNVYTFSVWDEEEKTTEKILSIHVFTGNDRENQAVAENRFLLYHSESTVCSAKLDASSVSYGITQESLINSFHLIHPDLYMGET